jgi:hypothetical protein
MTIWLKASALRTCAGSFKNAERLEQTEERLYTRSLCSKLDNHAVLTNIDDLRAELFRKHRDGVQMLVLETQRLRGRQLGRCRHRVGAVLEVVRKHGFALHLAVVVNAAWLVRGPANELLFEVFRAEDRDLGEKELARDHFRLCIVKDGPDRHLT